MAASVRAYDEQTSSGAQVGSLTFNKPTGTVEGDLLIILMQTDGGNREPDLPAGFTQVYKGEGSGNAHLVCYKAAGASEPSTYQVTISGVGGNTEACGVLITVQDAETDSPLSVDGTNGTTASTHVFNTPTSVDDDCFWICKFGFDGGDGGTHTISTGGVDWTKGDQVDSDGGSGEGCQLSWYTHTQTTAGAMPALSVDTVVSDGGLLVQLAIKPKAGDPEQEGYRWRNDDGSESTATWLAAQDTDISRGKLSTTRLRVLVNNVGPGRTDQFSLQYRRVGDADSEWEDVS